MRDWVLLCMLLNVHRCMCVQEFLILEDLVFCTSINSQNDLKILIYLHSSVFGTKLT